MKGIGRFGDEAQKWVAGNIFGIEEPEKPPAPPDPEIARRKAEVEATRKSNERRRKVIALGRPGTMTGGAAGLVTAASTRRKTLLGQ